MVSTLQRQLAATGLPIVFVTNHFDVRACVRAIKAGAVDFLTTPFRDSELLHAVHAAIAQYRDTGSQRGPAGAAATALCTADATRARGPGIVVSGLLNKQSACKLGISEVTLQVHRSRIMQKMAARSFADLVRMAAVLQIPLVCRHTVSPPPMSALELRPRVESRRELACAAIS